MSKKQQVLNYLKKGGTLTSLSAFNLCRTTRLSGLIFTLKKEGYSIKRKWEGTGQKSYIRYSLNKSK